MNVCQPLCRRAATLVAVALLVACDDAGHTPTFGVAPDATPATAVGGSGGGGSKGGGGKPPRIARVVVGYVSGALDTNAWTLPAGATAQFKATVYDSSGAVVTSVTPVFASTTPAAISIDSTAGLARAIATGTSTLTASVSGISGALHAITVPAPVPVEQPPAPPSATSVALSVMRFDGGTGKATVSAGVPLIAGMLFPGQESALHVTVGTTERPLYAIGLKALHPDGSLRAVLLQFGVEGLATGASLAARLDVGATRSAMLTVAAPLVVPGTLALGAPAGLPQAAALPSDPNYLVASGIVGTTETAAKTTARGGTWARYESDWAKFGTLLWGLEGSAWTANYYDRASIFDAEWVRTGDPQYYVRAQQLAYNYRHDYLEPNNYISSPHWAQLEGLEAHYLLTGDEASRRAVVNTAETLAGFIGSNYMSRVMGEGRIAARVLLSQLLAWRLTPNGSTPTGSPTRDWQARTEAALANIYAWEQADGSFPSDGELCGGQTNFMIGMLDEAMIRVHDLFVPKTTTQALMRTKIQSVVQKAADYMWKTQWLPASQAFTYNTVQCSPNSVGEMVGGPTPAPDLNQLVATTYGWLYKRTGTTSYLSAADAIFAGGVTQAFLNGSKQFNENYAYSYHLFGYR